MKITSHNVDVTKEDIIAYYELRLKQKERHSVATLSITMAGIFLWIPLLIAQVISEIININDPDRFLLEIILIQACVIVILAFQMLMGTYCAGRLYRMLRKNMDRKAVMDYVRPLVDVYPRIGLAYIMNEYWYQGAIITRDGMLSVSYMKGGSILKYNTYDYKVLCDEDCQDAILHVSMDGIFVTDKYHGEDGMTKEAGKHDLKRWQERYGQVGKGRRIWNRNGQIVKQLAVLKKYRLCCLMAQELSH